MLFTQGIKGVELRDKTVDFITNQVVTAFRTGLVTDPEIELFFVDEMRKVRLATYRCMHLKKKLHKAFSNFRFSFLHLLRVGYGFCLGQRTGVLRKDHYAYNIIQDWSVRGLDGTITYLLDPHYIRSAMECKRLLPVAFR